MRLAKLTLLSTRFSTALASTALASAAFASTAFASAAFASAALASSTFASAATATAPAPMTSAAAPEMPKLLSLSSVVWSRAVS